MKQIEIESWALRTLQNVEKHLPIEDSLVELKAEWPDPAKAARRIAAHANAARGERILWLVGVDEKQGIVGANHQELSNWHSSVQSHFDTVAPELISINISYAGKAVVALCFDTTRAPFVVKNPVAGQPAGGPVTWEVPWREGTRTRSATRNDLVLLLSPLRRTPKVEIIEGRVSEGGSVGGTALNFSLTVYVVPLDSYPVTFPFHKCKAVLSYEGKVVTESYNLTMTTPEKKRKAWANLRRAGIGGGDSSGHTINVKASHESVEATSDEIIVRSSGKVEIDGKCLLVANEHWPELNLEVTLVEAVSEQKVVLNARLTKPDANKALWTYSL